MEDKEDMVDTPMGNIKLKWQNLIYIYVGGSGTSGGFNGGGNGDARGGGATNIAVSNKGTLNNYISSQNDILIVAGGGGGGERVAGGNGGGGTSYAGAGGGGSGHINTNYVISGSMQNGIRVGDGYAKITQISY